jgi:hypothetical protein
VDALAERAEQVSNLQHAFVRGGIDAFFAPGCADQPTKRPRRGNGSHSPHPPFWRDYRKLSQSMIVCALNSATTGRRPD